MVGLSSYMFECTVRQLYKHSILSRFTNTFLHGIDKTDHFDSEPFICGEAQQRAISVAR